MFDDFPIIAFWETTQACELKCIHCRASSITQRSPEELNTEEAKLFIDQLSGFSRKPVLVFTGGNPLIREDIFDLIKYAHEKGIMPALAPTVSARLNDRALEMAKASGVRYISISLDGPEPAVHNVIRGVEGHFDQTVETIKKAISYGFEVQVNTAVMSLNKERIGEIFSLIKDLGVRTWEVFFLVPVGRAFVNLDMEPREYEAICNFLYDASFYDVTIRTVECPFIRRVLLERQKGINRSAGDALYLKLRKALEGYTPSSKTTLSPYGTLDGDGIIFVAYNGDIYPSGLLNLPIGNVRNDNIVSVYRETQLLKEFRLRNFKGKCGTCQYRYNCGGSRSRAFFYFRDPLQSDPACILVS